MKVIILQYITVLDQQVVSFKFTQCNISVVSVKLEKTRYTLYERWDAKASGDQNNPFTAYMENKNVLIVQIKI